MSVSVNAVVAADTIDPSSQVTGIAIAAMLVGLAFFFIGWKAWRLTVRLADAPTVPPSAVPFGQAESTGRAAVPEGLPSVGRKASVWYQFEVQRYETDSDNTASWNTHIKGVSTQWFLVTDDYGGVLVDPAGAQVEGATSTASDLNVLTVRQLEAATGKATSGNVAAESPRDLDEPIGSRRGRWRVLETSLPIGSTVTVVGPVLTHPTDAGTPVFRVDAAQRGSRGELHIARGSATEMQHRNAKAAALLSVVPIAIGIVLGIWAAINGYPFMGGAAIGAALYVPVAVQWALDRYNRLVVTANQVEACWSMIDVALTRRATLVPQLIATVEASFAHERTVQEALASTRWDGRPRIDVTGADAARAATAEVWPVFSALVERYPTLTSNENALELQRQLAATEHRLASARSVYNQAVQLLMDRMASFPDMVFARRFRHRRSQYWQL